MTFADELERMGAARWRGAGGARQEGRTDGTGIGKPGGTRPSRRSIRRCRPWSKCSRTRSPIPPRPAPILPGPFAGLPFLMKDLGPTMNGPPAGNGLAADARQSRHIRYVPDLEDAPGRAQFDRANHHAGIRRLQFGGKSRRLRHAQPVEHRLHHLRIVGRQCRDGRGGRGADRACHRRRRFDPHSGRRQRQYRPQGFARRVLAGAASLRLVGAGIDPGLPVAHGARYRRLRRCVPRSRARRIDAVLDRAGALSGHDQARSGTAQNRALAPMGRLQRDAADRIRTGERPDASSKASAITSTTRCPRSTIAPPSTPRPPATSAILRW